MMIDRSLGQPFRGMIAEEVNDIDQNIDQDSLEVSSVASLSTDRSFLSSSTPHGIEKYHIILRKPLCLT